MSRFELSIATDYVAEWTVVDAVRELFQNAIDQQSISEGNEMFFDYNEEMKQIQIGNKSSILEPKTLLLGASTKANDDRTIGKFGEGYKIATLVLLRNGKNITFYNYGAKEVWKPKFIQSRRYGSTILVFDIDKKFIWSKVPDKNLTIVIEGITRDEYVEIKKSNLHLQKLEESEIIESSYGNALLNEKYKSKIFVNGLFVCINSDFKYGYNIKPKHLPLDRDRRIIPHYDLVSITSSIWSKSNRDDIIFELLEEKWADVNMLYYKPSIYDLKNKIYLQFKEKYGENAIPINDTCEIETLGNGYKPIIVNYTYKDILTTSQHYVKPIKKPSTKELLVEWFENNRNNISEEEGLKFLDIIEKL